MTKAARSSSTPGSVAIDIFSDTLANALQAANELHPLNASGSASQPPAAARSTAPA